MSRYCDQHKACVCDSQELSGTEEDGAQLDAPIGPMLRSKKTVQELGEPIVEVIVAKKTTRHQTYYKVMFSTCMYTLILPVGAYNDNYYGKPILYAGFMAGSARM